MRKYVNRCNDGTHRATPRAIVIADGNVWIQWSTITEGGQPSALVTSSHEIGTDDIRHVCRCLLGEDRPDGSTPPGDLMGHVATIHVASYRVVTVSEDPLHGSADLSDDRLHGVYMPTESQMDAIRWCGLDLPPKARERITAAVRAQMKAPTKG